jgi:hypothetical protein
MNMTAYSAAFGQIPKAFAIFDLVVSHHGQPGSHGATQAAHNHRAVSR